ncbi:MAG: CCA tRNA nucleotidyltransferase [Fimbriimonadales bacterium]|nr:CCA tRNA nucleotidyltransferase [Fimbriimonadales bacterium]MCS7190455.1 CCA tRNA nucleotidyltransferase [Fimbriimonadales bacterium]
MLSETLDRLRTGLAGTPYEGRVYLVGGYVRDKLLGRPLPNDIDLVLEGDALALAQFLFERGIADHHPVTYPRFGTAMVHVGDTLVELVTARAESYHDASRKPQTVRPATLREDALRRDFTVNTLLENLHTGEIVDPLGVGLSDLHAKRLRTPRDPHETFYEDPLRMLRAVRFAVQLGFEIDPAAYQAILEQADRLAIVSIERIQTEFTRLMDLPQAAAGLQMLLDTRLLHQFGQPLLPMVGCTQNEYHLYDVWGHSLKTVEFINPEGLALPAWELRLAALLHDVGKPATRTVDAQGEVHFYEHDRVGARIAAEWLRFLRYPNATIERIATLVKLHMRPGFYTPVWKDSAVRRLIRDAGELLEPLLRLAEADIKAQRHDVPHADLAGLRARIQQVQAAQSPQKWRSPLTGEQIMQRFGLKPGPLVGRIKTYLEEQVIEGNLAPDDVEGAWRLAEAFLKKH